MSGKMESATKISTISRPECPLCGSPGKVLHEGLKDRLYSAPGEWTMKKCPNAECGLGWLDPVAVESDLGLLYANYYTHVEHSLPSGAKAWLRGVLVQAYEIAKSVPLVLLGLSNDRRQSSLMYLEDRPAGYVLDLGCGDGQMLHRLGGKGWKGIGIDFDAKAIQTARQRYGGLEMEFKQTDLFGAGFKDATFDAVIMNHVMEHVPAPVPLLREVRRVLKNGGRLVATTPNLGSMGHEWFDACWRGLEPPRHLHVFTLRALEMAARQAGFNSVTTKSSPSRADLIFGGSMSLQEALRNNCRIPPGRDIRIFRAIRSSVLQWREALLWRSKPDCGEEAILICEK